MSRLADRVARLEAATVARRPVAVVCVDPGETEAQAVARTFPSGWPPCEVRVVVDRLTGAKTRGDAAN